MVGLIHGPFGERFELVRASEARPSQSALPDDPVLLEAFLFRLLDSPWNEHTLRRALDAGFGEGMWDGPTLVRLIAARIARGELRIRFLDRQRAPSGGVTGDDDDVEIDEPVSSDPEIHPCDFEAIIFKCSHMPDPEGDSKREITEIRFWRDGKLDYDNLREPHGGGVPSKIIEVVASHLDRGADDISVTLEGGPGYTCSKTHPKITVIDAVDGRQVFEGETKINFGAKCKALPAPPSAYSSPGALIAYYFFPDQAINSYTVDVESCGVLSDGSMGFGRSQHRIRAYPSDLYELSLSIPSFKKTTYEKEADDFRSTFQKDWKKKDPKKGLDKPVAELAGDIGASFSFTRSGEDIEGSAEIGETIRAIVQLEKEIRSIMDFVQDFQPGVGWKLVFEVELFKGSLKYEWGYKEWKDHTAYKWWKFNIAMTLIKLAIELKFGIELRVWRFGVELVVFGKMTIDAKVSASKEASAADPSPWELAVSSDPKGELGIRGALGADWVTVEGKLEFGLGFKAKCKCSTSKPFGIDWSIDRKETKLQAEGKIKWVGSFSRSKTLIAQKKGWAKGRFPAADKKLAA